MVISFKFTIKLSRAKQIDRQLSQIMKRVEDVLGTGWEYYAEGQKLQNESIAFRKKLDTTVIFENWLSGVNKQTSYISGFIFEINRTRSQSNQFALSVNFDTQIIQIFKEVRNLLWMGFQIPHSINNLALDAKRVYPYAISLSETVRLYSKIVEKVKENESISELVSNYHKDVQKIIS